MTPAEASRLTIGSRVWFQADMLVTGLPNGIYEVLDRTDETIAGRRSVRILIARDPDIWARPANLGKIAREQQGRQ